MRIIDREKAHRVFISYSWDSEEHKAQVKRLADMLNEESDVACMIDQYEPDPGHLPNWMAQQIEWATKLLLVFSPIYYEKFMGDASASSGRGAQWEGAIIQQRLYEGNFLHQRECRALLSPDATREEHVPRMLRSFVCYELPSGRDDRYERLLADFIRSSAEPNAPSSKADDSLPDDVERLLDQAKELTDAGKHASAIPILKDALQLADEGANSRARIKARYHLGYALYEALEDFGSAETCFREALSLVPVGNLELRHDALHGLGDMLLFAGRLDEAKATMHAALEAARATGKKGDLAASLISQSLLERTQGLHDQAVTALDEAIQLLLQRDLSLAEEKRKRDNAHLLAVCYTNKALLLRDSGDLDGALALYDKAEKYQEASGDELNATKLSLLRGEVHCARADWDSGYKCFRNALKGFVELDNDLWIARSFERIARLYATHHKWEVALEFISLAVSAAARSGNPEEQVRFLLSKIRIARSWKREAWRKRAIQAIRSESKDLPPAEKSEAMAHLTAKMGELTEVVDSAVQTDREIMDLFDQAKEIAIQAKLSDQIADCLLEEAYGFNPSGDDAAKKTLIGQAIDLLQEKLNSVESPKRRAHLMGRLSALCQEHGDRQEALSWLSRAGEIFERTGDVFGLANYYGSLAEIHRLEGRLDDEIKAQRKVLSLIEGRSFYPLAAGTRINLAVSLRFRRDYSEAQRLLDEAEVICKKHELTDFVVAIAQNRSRIESEIQALQAPTQTLSELLQSFGELVEYRPERAVAYLPFWLFAWKNELLALVRSGALLSLMVVTDDVERFLSFAQRFRHFADHFLMATSQAPTVDIESGLLPIPPRWRFPAHYPLVGVRRKAPIGESPSEGIGDEELPSVIKLAGPARMFPPYVFVEAAGEGRVMPLVNPRLPEVAVDLMVRRPVEELQERKAVWFSTDRFESKDPFLTDLRAGYERGVIPVYFDRFPTSNAVADCGNIEFFIPEALLEKNRRDVETAWRRALVRLTALAKAEARQALLDLSNLFGELPKEGLSLQMGIRLFEFSEIGKPVCHPAIVVKGAS